MSGKWEAYKIRYHFGCDTLNMDLFYESIVAQTILTKD